MMMIDYYDYCNDDHHDNVHNLLFKPFSLKTYLQYFFLSFDYFLIAFQTPVDYSLIAFLFLMFLIAFLCSANIRKITFSPFPVSQRNISQLLLQQENIIQQYSDFQIQDLNFNRRRFIFLTRKNFQNLSDWGQVP